MIILGPLLNVIYDLLGLYKFLLVIYVVLNLLESFNVVNKYNTAVYTVHNFLQSITEPVLGPIRRVIPPISGWDLSPMALIFVVYFFQGVVLEIIKRFPS